MGGGRVIEVEGRKQWDEYVSKSAREKKLVVVDFTATWCGPCKIMAPVFEELSNTYTNAYFLKLDVDNNGELASEFGVRGIPAFHFLKGGAKVDEMVGADQSRLRALVDKHYTAATFQGQGRVLGSASSEPSSSTPAFPADVASASASGPPSSDVPAVDESRPVTSIQFRLPDGSRLVGRFNTDASVASVRAFVAASRPALPTSFSMMNSFPPRPLSQDQMAQSIEEAGLLNASLQIR